MPAALCDVGPAVASASPAPRRRKFLFAGAAVVGATAMAMSPVTPTPTATPVAIQEHAVELTAVVGPIAQLQESFDATLTNLSGLRNNLLGTAAPAGESIIANTPAVLGELVEAAASDALNPVRTVTALGSVVRRYAAIAQGAVPASNEALATAFGDLPNIVRNTLGYLREGQFVEAFSEVNIYVLVALLERPFVPLVPLLALPGDLAAAAGAPIVGNVLDAVFSRRDGVNGVTRAVLAPAITAVLQGAVVLDEVRAAYETGDTATAARGLASLPGYVANAFVNGFVPPFPSRSTFPGLLSDGGPLDFALVDVPRVIAAGLTAPTTPPAPSAQTAVLSVETAAPATSARQSASVESIESAAPAETAEVAVRPSIQGTARSAARAEALVAVKDADAGRTGSRGSQSGAAGTSAAESGSASAAQTGSASRGGSGAKASEAGSDSGSASGGTSRTGSSDSE